MDPRQQIDALAHFDRLPPAIVYMIGLGVTKLPFGELVKASGMPMRTFARIASAKSWSNIGVAQAGSFCRACHVDIINQRRAIQELRKIRFGDHALSVKAVQLRRFQQRLSEMREGRIKASAAPEPQS